MSEHEEPIISGELTDRDIEKHIERPTYGENDWFPRYAGEKYVDPRSEHILRRAETVRKTIGNLLLSHYEESPHARWSAASIVHKVAEETGLARALITNHMQDFSDRKVPLAEEGPTISWGTDRGQHYIQVVPVENPIIDFRETE